jgi:hypothetical protein
MLSPANRQGAFCPSILIVAPPSKNRAGCAAAAWRGLSRPQHHVGADPFRLDPLQFHRLGGVSQLIALRMEIWRSLRISVPRGYQGSRPPDACQARMAITGDALIGQIKAIHGRGHKALAQRAKSPATRASKRLAL